MTPRILPGAASAALWLTAAAWLPAQTSLDRLELGSGRIVAGRLACVHPAGVWIDRAAPSAFPDFRCISTNEITAIHWAGTGADDLEVEARLEGGGRISGRLVGRDAQHLVIDRSQESAQRDLVTQSMSSVRKVVANPVPSPRRALVRRDDIIQLSTARGSLVGRIIHSDALEVWIDVSTNAWVRVPVRVATAELRGRREHEEGAAD